jgi:hypothetical protein
MARARLEWLGQSPRFALGKWRKAEEAWEKLLGQGGHMGREANTAAVMSSAKDIPEECWDLAGGCVGVCAWGMCLRKWESICVSPLPLLLCGPPVCLPLCKECCSLHPGPLNNCCF